MSFIEETITKLLQIAQNSRNESAFQKDTDYMKFKSIKGLDFILRRKV